MAIADLFLGNVRTNAARYQGSRAEQNAMRQTSGLLQNRATNPAAAAQALQGARADQRAANAGMIAQAQAADETARAQGAVQLVGTGLSTLGSILPFATMGGGGAAQGAVDAGLGAAQGALGQAPAGPAAPPPSVAETSFQGFQAGLPGMGQPQTAWQQYGQPQSPFVRENPYASPMVKPQDGLQQGYTPNAGLDAAGNPLVPKPAWMGYDQAPPAPNYAPQVPQSAMPAERQGQPAPGAGQGGNMMRPVESTLLSTGMPGRYIPGGDPLAEGAPPQEQAPALNPMAARLAGMAPVQGALSPGQLAPPVPASPSDQFMMLLQQSAFPYLDNLDPGAGSRPLRYLRSQ